MALTTAIELVLLLLVEGTNPMKRTIIVILLTAFGFLLKAQSTDSTAVMKEPNLLGSLSLGYGGLSEYSGFGVAGYFPFFFDLNFGIRTTGYTKSASTLMEQKDFREVTYMLRYSRFLNENLILHIAGGFGETRGDYTVGIDSSFWLISTPIKKQFSRSSQVVEVGLTLIGGSGFGIHFNTYALISKEVINGGFQLGVVVCFVN